MEEHKRVTVYLRASPRSSWATALTTGPGAAIELTLPPTASVRELRDAVAHKLQILHRDDTEDAVAAVAVAVDLPAVVRNEQTKLIFGGQVLSGADTLELGAAGVRDGASLNLVLPARPHLIVSPPSSSADADATASTPAGSVGRSGTTCRTALLPHVEQLQPSMGLTSGGQRVMIIGSNFLPNCRCRFGPTRNLSVVYHSAELLEVITPPHPAGVVSVQICNPIAAGQQRVTPGVEGQGQRREMQDMVEEGGGGGESNTSSREAREDATSHLAATEQGSWSNGDVLFHYISREQLEREVLVPAAADSCREKIAEALYGMGASSINYRRDDEDGFMG